jgi:nucleotide-binding universal stress UspA family protein
VTAPVFVVGYDGSPPARAALVYAAGRVGVEGGRIVVVVVHPSPPGDLDEKARQALLADHERACRSLLDALAADPPPELEGLDWTPVIEHGAPARCLLRVAARVGATAVVVGSFGRGRVASLLGSVAHDLLREADRPVVVIPPKAVEALKQP